ncbi:MAG: type II toxin-antitoxin system prevent-host-death family antitoxin [Actinobacteria bacterium]|nr:type II toxin-antitoxin system prevent-host-death family antitoxin [Actinomycetota bacterium]
MGVAWQLQEAKQRFSELVRRAEREGPQVVTRHGEEVVVVVPAEEWRRMSEREGGEKKIKPKPTRIGSAPSYGTTPTASCPWTSKPPRSGDA